MGMGDYMIEIKENFRIQEIVYTYTIFKREYCYSSNYSIPIRQERRDKIFNENNPNPIIKNIVEYIPNKEVFGDKINKYKDKLKRV